MSGGNRRPGGTSARGRRAPGARPPRTGSPGRIGEAVRPKGGSRSEAPGRRSEQASRRLTEPLTRLSGPARRIAVLGAVLVLLALMLVPTVRAWYEQRQELAELRSKVTTQEQTVQALQDEKQRWSDPAYVEQQARQRLKFVKPGEVAFTVIGADKLAETREGQVRGQMVAPADDEQMSWYTQLWTSVELTDGIGRGTTRLDGKTIPTPTDAPTTRPTQTPSAPQSVPGAGGDQQAPARVPSAGSSRATTAPSAGSTGATTTSDSGR